MDDALVLEIIEMVEMKEVSTISFILVDDNLFFQTAKSKEQLILNGLEKVRQTF